MDTRLPNCYGEEKKQVSGEIERGLDEARGAIFDMEAEARAAPGSFRMMMTNRVRAHNETLARFTQQLKTIMKNEAGMSTTRQLLFENDSGPSNAQNRDVDDAVRRTVRQGTEVLERTSQSIYRSTQVALETEEIGTGVIQELDTQREALTRTRDRLMETDMELSRSRRILRSMARVALTNKLVLILIIIAELGILGGLIYYKFF